MSAILASLACIASLPPPTTVFEPAVMLRKNIRNLTATELQGLRDAVAAMKALPASDPCSWTFQANIHNTSCNHSQSYWLPWHRLYLYYFEKILVAKSGGKLKGLPFWDYAKSTQTTFPSAFYPSTYGAGIPNPLYHTPRTNVTSATWGLDFASTNPASANTNLVFNAFSGSIQSKPHNYTHIAISGTMGTFQSPLDAVFWLHHAECDLLWVRWLALGGGRANPTGDSTWMNTSFTFYDYDAGCTQVTKKVSDCLNTETQLNYKYVEPLVLVPAKFYWKWIQLLPPIRFLTPRSLPLAYEKSKLPIQMNTADLRRLTTARRAEKAQINVVLRFRVEKGENTIAPVDLKITPRALIAGRAQQPLKVANLAMFGVRQKQMEGHAHGPPGVFEVTLPPDESAKFLDAFAAGKMDLDFEPHTRGVRRLSNVQQPVLKLESMSIMKAVRVNLQGRVIRDKDAITE